MFRRNRDVPQPDFVLADTTCKIGQQTYDCTRLLYNSALKRWQQTLLELALKKIPGVRFVNCQLWQGTTIVEAILRPTAIPLQVRRSLPETLQPKWLYSADGGIRRVVSSIHGTESFEMHFVLHETQTDADWATLIERAERFGDNSYVDRCGDDTLFVAVVAGEQQNPLEVITAIAQWCQLFVVEPGVYAATLR